MKKFFNSLKAAISQGGDYFGNILESIITYYSHSGMTGETRETMDYENSLFQQNWDERTGPRAQINATALGFDDVGLNRMLMAGNQPGATASSPSAPAGNGSDILGSIIGTIMQAKQIDNDFKLREYQNQTERMNAETNKFRTQVEAFLTREKWKGERTRNKYLDERENATLQGQLLSNAKTFAERYQIEANTSKILQDTEYAKILTKYAPRLFESQVKERESLSTLNYARAREVEMLTIKHSHEIAQIDALRDKLYNEASYILTQDRLSERYIEESEARCAKINKEIEEIGSRIGLNELDLQYYDWNHPRTTKVFGVAVPESKRPVLRW